MAESHIRIDEGITRGPRNQPDSQPDTQTDSAVEDANKPIPYDQGKLANVNVQGVLERYLGGETTTQIAASLGVTRQGLGWWMRKHAEDDWKDPQVILAFERKERAEDALSAANDALSLARAREQLRGAQWELERVLSRIYAQKQEVTGKDGGPLQVQIVRFGQVIEGESSVVDDAQCSATTPVLPPVAKP